MTTLLTLVLLQWCSCCIDYDIHTLSPATHSKTLYRLEITKRFKKRFEKDSSEPILLLRELWHVLLSFLQTKKLYPKKSDFSELERAQSDPASAFRASILGESPCGEFPHRPWKGTRAQDRWRCGGWQAARDNFKSRFAKYEWIQTLFACLWPIYRRFGGVNFITSKLSNKNPDKTALIARGASSEVPTPLGR